MTSTFFFFKNILPDNNINGFYIKLIIFLFVSSHTPWDRLLRYLLMMVDFLDFATAKSNNCSALDIAQQRRKRSSRDKSKSAELTWSIFLRLPQKMTLQKRRRRRRWCAWWWSKGIMDCHVRCLSFVIFSSPSLHVLINDNWVRFSIFLFRVCNKSIMTKRVALAQWQRQ